MNRTINFLFSLVSLATLTRQFGLFVLAVWKERWAEEPTVLFNGGKVVSLQNI